MNSNVTAGGQPLRVGVVGLGYTGRQHLAGYSEIPGVEITALAGQESGPLAELAAQYEIPHTYTRWEDLVARDDLDVVSVCTPNHLHAPITIAALNGGRHVLCEKPLARNAEEATAMVRAAEASDRVLEVCFNHRRRGDVAALKHYVDTDVLGEVYLAKATWTRRDGFPTGLGWFGNRELSGGGPLIDLGVHVLDLVMYLLGEPKVMSVTASTYDRLGPRTKSAPASGEQTAGRPPFDVEDIATAFLRLENGATLLLEASWAGYASPAGDTYGVTLFGGRGGARLESRNYAVDDTLEVFAEVAGSLADIKPVIALAPERTQHRGLIDDFVRTIRSGDYSAHHGHTGLERSLIIEACYRSAREGREVRIDELTGTAD